MKDKGTVLFVLLFAALAMLFITLLAIPPWESRIPFLVQGKIGQWTGIYFHHFPSDYTGTFRIWDENGKLTEEDAYKNGKRDGIWIHYDSAGKKTITEYRDDKPWDGICYIQKMKSWTAEYRQGNPWNGCFPTYNGQTSDYSYQYFINGVQTSEIDYKTRNHIPNNAQCYGLQYILTPTSSQLSPSRIPST